MYQSDGILIVTVSEVLVMLLVSKYLSSSSSTAVHHRTWLPLNLSLFPLVCDNFVFFTLLCFMGLGCQPTAQPPTWTSKVSLFSWNLSLLTCLAWETLPVAMLLLAVLWRLMDHTNPTATMRWRCHWEDFIHTLLKNMTYCVAMIQLQNITEIEMSLSIL